MNEGTKFDKVLSLLLEKLNPLLEDIRAAENERQSIFETNEAKREENSTRIDELAEQISKSGIIEITEETYIYDLAPGIYKINADDDSYCIYMDDCYWIGLYEGIVSFSYSECENMYSWFYVGRDMNSGTTANFGKTYWSGDYWLCEDYIDIYNDLESKANRVNDFKKAGYDNYPSTKAVVNYVAEQLANVGGSNIDLVTEFKGTDVDYEEKQVYNANVVNAVLSAIAENFATTEYVNKLIGGIENGSY